MSHALPTVIAHIQGGLGNQLFCYATARAVSLRNGLDLKLNTRTSYRNEKYQRDCLLHRFNIDAKQAGAWQAYRGLFGRTRRSFSAKRDAKKPLGQRTLIKEPRDQRFMPELLELKPSKHVYLLGYWQDERYFADARSTLLNEFTLSDQAALKPDAALDERTRQPDTVSVHCRSYSEVANPPPGLVLGVDYYKRAFETVLDRVPEATFVVFSDDRRWAKQLIDATGFASRTHYAPTPTGEPTNATLMDFTLMRQCRHHVVANSSFSWWTAWLGERAGSVVVAPSIGLPGHGRLPLRWVHKGV